MNRIVKFISDYFENIKGKDNSLVPFLVVNSFLCLTLFVFGPLNIYIPNADELAFGIKDVLLCILPSSVLVFCLITVLYFLIMNKHKVYYVLLLFGVTFALYVQGNYFKLNFGSSVLDGTAVDWTKYNFRAVINFVFWAFVIILPFIIYGVLKNKKTVLKYAMIVSLFLLAIQIPAVIVQLLSYESKSESSLIVKNDGMFEYSEDENIIIIILDAMDEKYYEEFLTNNPDYIKELDGFTAYDNTLTGGSRTMMAMPIIFTGIPFTDYNSYTEYLEDAYSKDNILRTLNEKGYDVKVYSESLFFPLSSSEYVDNFTLTKNSVSSRTTLTKKLYKVTFYKYFPIVFKPFLLFDTSEFNKAIHTNKSYSVNDVKFYSDFLKNGISTNDSDKTFILYHLNGAHSPYTMNQNAEKEEGSTLQKQVEGSFKIVKELLDQYRNNNIYDNSTIIITADHGDYDVCQHPFLLIKEKNSNTSYQTSHKPISSFDFPIFISNIAGIELNNQVYGVDISSLKEDDIRERYLFNNQSGSSKMFVNEYVTKSTARDYDSLEKIKIYEQNTMYDLGTELSFQVDNTANRYTVEGFGYTTGYRTKLRGPIAIMEIPFSSRPEKETIHCYITLHSLSNPDYRMVIKANGVEVYDEVIDKKKIKSGVSFDIPQSVFDSNNLKLEFLFPDIPESEMEKTSTKRTETVSFKTIIFE